MRSADVQSYRDTDRDGEMDVPGLRLMFLDAYAQTLHCVSLML